MSFPKYYHVEDLYGNVFALICQEHETSYTVIQKRDVRKSFIVSKVSNEQAVKDLAPGQILGCSTHDYEEVLRKEFGFSMSATVLCNKADEGAKANVEKTILDDNVKPTAGIGVPSPSHENQGSTDDSAGSDETDGGDSGIKNPPDHVEGNAGSGGGNDVEDTGKGDTTAPPEPANDGSTDPKPVQKSGVKKKKLETK